MENIFDKFRLDGQVALVTGGAGLLGKQFCKTLAQAGAAVVVADLNEAAACQIAQDLCDIGGKAIGVGVDVTRPDSVKGLVDAAVKGFGRLDILVCSAALDPKFDSSHAGQHRNTF